MCLAYVAVGNRSTGNNNISTSNQYSNNNDDNIHTILKFFVV